MELDLSFKDVQYVYTHNCSLAEKTNYCVVPKSATKKANIKEIKKACDIFKKFNLQVKVLGGNPSDEDDFCQFVDYINSIKLDYAVTDNAINVEKLLSTKVKGVMFSLDTLGNSDIGGCSYIKSMKAKEAIKLYYDMFNYIGANVVINKLNIDEVPKIIEFLTEHNAIANICPLITGKNKNFDFLFRAEDSQYSLNTISRDKITELSKTLIEMKHAGYLIGCPKEYIEHLPDAIINSWNCYNISSIPILRVNTDLSLMICSDVKGTEILKYTIFDLENNFNDINKAWLTDQNRKYCCEQNGCYWSNILISDTYRKKGYGTIEATKRNL